jgi:hypothetical protein
MKVIDMQKRPGIRILTVTMIFLFSISMTVSAFAATYSLKASYYLDYYSVTADTGKSGNVIVKFDVNATRVMDSVGASYIVVQEYSNGTWKGVGSYFGSTSNGMLASDTNSTVGSITYIGTAGKQYRALVTVYAGSSAGSDSRTITTNTVTAR